MKGIAWNSGTLASRDLNGGAARRVVAVSKGLLFPQGARSDTATEVRNPARAGSNLQVNTLVCGVAAPGC